MQTWQDGTHNSTLQFLDLPLTFQPGQIGWQYNLRTKKDSLPYTSAHSKLVKRSIISARLSSALNKSCPPSCLKPSKGNWQNKIWSVTLQNLSLVSLWLCQRTKNTNAFTSTNQMQLNPRSTSVHTLHKPQPKKDSQKTKSGSSLHCPKSFSNWHGRTNQPKAFHNTMPTIPSTECLLWNVLLALFTEFISVVALFMMARQDVA